MDLCVLSFRLHFISSPDVAIAVSSTCMCVGQTLSRTSPTSAIRASETVERKLDGEQQHHRSHVRQPVCKAARSDTDRLFG